MFTNVYKLHVYHILFLYAIINVLILLVNNKNPRISSFIFIHIKYQKCIYTVLSFVFIKKSDCVYTIRLLKNQTTG